MSAEEIEDVEEKRIYLPAPEGHRRSKFLFRNGLQQSVDMSPEELIETVDAFRAGTDDKLVLRDPDFGDIFALYRNALEEEILAVFVMYHQNPAPQTGDRGGGLMVARDMPNHDLENARRRRRLN